jgi:peptidoglycan/xylan/chitin deacetylase (PgdA/CDA1 family)
MENIVSLFRRPVAALGRRVLGTITGVSTRHPVIALTFDDGPHPQFTPMMLEVLKRHRARATFFMLGEYASKYPDIVESVARDGHAIGNHSWDHPSFPLISSNERRRQIRSCGQALVPHGIRIFRPPFGHQTLRTRFDALVLGYRVIAWDIDADDWRDRDASWIADRVGQQAKPGSIILFHDALASVLEERHESREQTLEAVNMLLTNLSDRFRFITVPELLLHGKPQRVKWDKQAQAGFLERRRKSYGNTRDYLR